MSQRGYNRSASTARENTDLKSNLKSLQDILVKRGYTPKSVPSEQKSKTRHKEKGNNLFEETSKSTFETMPKYQEAKQKHQKETDAWKQRLNAVLNRMEEMIYKESNILFPNCALNFSEEEWYHIYRDAKDYAECFGIRGDSWEAAEAHLADTASTVGTMSAEHAFADGETRIHLPGGSLTLSQLTAMLNTIPLEITFVDIDNVNRYFNEGPKVFKRPGMALDREVFTCHPPKIEEQVRRIIGEFRAGNLDQVPVWMDKNGRTFLVTYYAVRDKQEQYLGTLELVQDMEFAKEHFR